MIIKPAERLTELKEYYFSSKLKEVAKLKSEGKDIINLGIGSPDLAPDSRVISRMIEEVISPQNHGYQPYQGISELRDAISKFYETRLKWSCDSSQILPLMGSKEGITHISMAYLNPGDQVLIPALGYPTYTAVTKMLGAQPLYYPLVEEANWEPDWAFLESQDYSKIKLLWLNYPHMPTGRVSTLELLERFVDLAIRKGVLLCHDNPYSFILNDHPLSIFNVAGALEVAVELSSLSKTFNMAGWRVGWLAGDPALLDPVMKVKSNMDSGMFKPLQLAAVEALRLGDEWYIEMNKIYAERRALVNNFLAKVDCKVSDTQAGMFVWAKVTGETSDDLCDTLLYEKGIFITPGHIFGEAGASFVRLSLCMPAQTIQKAIDRL